MENDEIKGSEKSVRAFDYPPLSMYLSEVVRDVYAINMLVFSSNIFMRSEIIKNFNKVAAMHASGEAKDSATMQSNLEHVLLDALVDSVRVGICFENYFKVKLMLADVFIHAIDQNRDKQLAKDQRGKPIYVREIISQKPPVDEQDYKTSMVRLEYLFKKQTINYTTILEVKDYVDLLQLPADTIDFLKEQNGYRNDLHMVTSQRFMLSDDIVKQYGELLRIVGGDMARLQNSLLDKITPDSRSRLPILYQ